MSIKGCKLLEQLTDHLCFLEIFLYDCKTWALTIMGKNNLSLQMVQSEIPRENI
jgi:hypothetical protein